MLRGRWKCVHGRSGSVALPRVNVVLARAVCFPAEGAEERMAVRRALERKRVVAMVVLSGFCGSVVNW